MDKGLGAVTWWGFSPVLDLLEYFKLCEFAAESDSLNILLVGSADIRHIIKAMTKTKMKENKIKRIHFYILENNLELYARMLLLLSLAMEQPENLGLQEKTELMAEIFANTLVRKQTASYIQSASNELVKMVTDFDFLKEKLPLFDLERLKYKERDMLEGIFKLWRKPDINIFDIEQCWDIRVRQYLGTRYDTAKGAFDWDYSMKLSDRGAEIIGSRCYQRWRKTGIAFELREGDYNVPNKTLASGMIFKVDGERQGRRGYWGDIVVSPFIAFGIECEDQNYFKRANKQFVSDSEEITKCNLTGLLNQLQTGEPYVATQDSNANNAEAAMATISEEEEGTEVEGASGDGKSQDTMHSYMPCDNVTISFLPLNSLPDLATKPKYQKLFDVVYFSNSMVHHLVPPISDLFSDKSLLIMETAKFITELSREQYIQFTNKIDGMAKAVGCQTLVDCNPEKDSFVFYKFQREDQKC